MWPEEMHDWTVQPACAHAPLTALIATPERFDGQVVCTIGFLSLESEGRALYLSEDSFRHLTDEAVWLNPPKGRGPAALEEKYVLVRARVNAKAHGHFGLFPAELSALGIRFWSDSECPSRPPRQPAP